MRDDKPTPDDTSGETTHLSVLYLVVRPGDRWIGVADTRHDGQPRGYDANR